MTAVPGRPTRSIYKAALRLIGVALLGWLLARLGLDRVAAILARVDLRLALAAALLLIPQIALKTVRWQQILAAQGIRYPFRLAFSAYLVSLLAGLVTPGRVGEFTKVVSVCKECSVSTGLALSGVLADRVLDLGVVALVGGLGLLRLGRFSVVWLVISLLLVVFPVYLFLSERGYTHLAQTSARLGRWGAAVFAPDGWVAQMRQGLLSLRGQVLAMVGLTTILAYGLYFLQAYWLAESMGLRLDFVSISYAVALGGLVSLLPISISGLGTREAVIVTYLGRLGIPAEQAVSLSLLIFSASYIFGSVLGALAWLYHPIPFSTSTGDNQA